MEIQNEIDKLLTLKESFSKIAGSYSSLVHTEFVTIQLHAENTDLSAYKIKVVNTTSGNEEFYDISASGYTEFEIKYDSVYEIVFPIIGAYITPATRTFTAQKPIRKIEASYVMAGVFGLDEQGNRYSLEQIEALADKSIIKYGGYTDEYLENYQKADGTYGCGFMWGIDSSYNTIKWASANVEFSQDLLPFMETIDMAKEYCDGEAYTTYIISEGLRLSVNTPAASLCRSNNITIGSNILTGFLLSSGQHYRLSINETHYKNLYDTLGKTDNIDISVGRFMTSCQGSIATKVTAAQGKGDIVINDASKTTNNKSFVCYPLPK